MAVVFDGIVYGLQLSILAVGMTLIYGLGGVLNLAHGHFVTVAAIGASVFIGAGVPTAGALAAAVALAGALALLIDATVMRPVYRLDGEARVLLSLLVTLGAAFVLDGLLTYAYPRSALTLRAPDLAVELLGVPVRSGSVTASILAIAAIGGLIVFLRYTRRGKAVRSIIEDEEGARLCGIDPARVRTVIFGLSGVLAGLVAVTQGLVSSVGAAGGLDFTVLALIVTVVGGLGSVTGAMLAGLLLGVVHTLSAFYMGAHFTAVVLLLAAMATILLRPSGLMGRGA